MKERGRPVIPWFQTVFVVTLVASILGILVMKIGFGSDFTDRNISTMVFLSVFILIGCVCFFSVKHYFFDSGKHIILAQRYIEEYSLRKRLFIKTISIGILLLIPLLLGLIIWINAK
jgi:hypothetical protein